MSLIALMRGPYALNEELYKGFIRHDFFFISGKKDAFAHYASKAYLNTYISENTQPISTNKVSILRNIRQTPNFYVHIDTVFYVADFPTNLTIRIQ